MDRTYNSRNPCASCAHSLAPFLLHCEECDGGDPPAGWEPEQEPCEPALDEVAEFKPFLSAAREEAEKLVLALEHYTCNARHYGRECPQCWTSDPDNCRFVFAYRALEEYRKGAPK